MPNTLRFLTRNDLGLIPLECWSEVTDLREGDRWDGIHRPDNESDRLLAELDGMPTSRRRKDEEED